VARLLNEKKFGAQRPHTAEVLDYCSKSSKSHIFQSGPGNFVDTIDDTAVSVREPVFQLLRAVLQISNLKRPTPAFKQLTSKTLLQTARMDESTFDSPSNRSLLEVE